MALALIILLLLACLLAPLLGADSRTPEERDSRSSLPTRQHWL
jgi:hypothetical protein